MQQQDNNIIHRDDHKKLTRIIHNLIQNDHSVEFRKPVYYKSLGLDDYKKIVKRPMDLNTIRRNLNKNIYQDIDTFVLDVLLIWNNCKLYNEQGSWIYDEAVEMQNYFKEQFLENYSEYEFPDPEALLKEMYDELQASQQKEGGGELKEKTTKKESQQQSSTPRKQSLQEITALQQEILSASHTKKNSRKNSTVTSKKQKNGHEKEKENNTKDEIFIEEPQISQSPELSEEQPENQLQNQQYTQNNNQNQYNNNNNNSNLNGVITGGISFLNNHNQTLDGQNLFDEDFTFANFNNTDFTQNNFHNNGNSLNHINKQSQQQQPIYLDVDGLLPQNQNQNQNHNMYQQQPQNQQQLDFSNVYNNSEQQSSHKFNNKFGNNSNSHSEQHGQYKAHRGKKQSKLKQKELQKRKQQTLSLLQTDDNTFQTPQDFPMQLGPIHSMPIPHHSLLELTKMMSQADRETIEKVFNALYYHAPDLVRENGENNFTIQFSQVTYTTFEIIKQIIKNKQKFEGLYEKKLDNIFLRGQPVQEGHIMTNLDEEGNPIPIMSYQQFTAEATKIQQGYYRIQRSINQNSIATLNTRSHQDPSDSKQKQELIDSSDENDNDAENEFLDNLSLGSLTDLDVTLSGEDNVNINKNTTNDNNNNNEDDDDNQLIQEQNTEPVNNLEQNNNDTIMENNMEIEQEQLVKSDKKIKKSQELEYINIDDLKSKN